MNKALIWIVVAVVVIGGGYWLLKGNAPTVSDDGTPVAADKVDDTSAQPSQPSDTGASVDVGATVGAVPTSATVTYNGSSFSPSTVTIAKGGTVTFTSAGGTMWVASAPHPAHTGYDGTDRATHCAAGYAGAAPFDQCSGGTSYTFTFTKTGTWAYHNHMNSSAFGKVVVQ